MRVVIFCHSLLSDWNHGNAHFLRGVSSELIFRGHQLRLLEPVDAWSVQNLLAEYGESPLHRFKQAYPLLEITRYEREELDVYEALDSADLVLVHEWNDLELVRRVGEHRLRHGGYTLLFHDTHHRSVTAPHEMARYDLQHYDGVLAFGASVAEVYLRQGWSRRVWTWHEAADSRVFHPIPGTEKEGDLVWIGNWGDGERTTELQEFLVEPVRSLRLKASIHGVRYPPDGVAALTSAGIDFRGWIPNFDVPRVYSRHRVTVHVPRRPYASALPGVPTIRMFEALACAMPLVSAPWNDTEGLFTAGEDFLFARNGGEMKKHLEMLIRDPAQAETLGAHGRDTVMRRHTCTQRVDELLEIHQQLQSEWTATAGGTQ
jgi:spore maturation protein CgeB